MAKSSTKKRRARKTNAHQQRPAAKPIWQHSLLSQAIVIAGASLPGGDFAVDGFAAEVDHLRRSCPVLEDDHARRLVRAYGTIARQIVAGVTDGSDWGEHFGADLREREVRYLIENEWARTADDVLWRRSKLGLRLSDAEAARLDAWMQTAARGGQDQLTARR